MKKLACLAFCVALSAARMSSAAAVLDFGTGAAGAGGTIADLGGGNAQGSNIFIDNLFVTGTSMDGSYDVNGNLMCHFGVSGSCGALSFDTLTNTFSIVGSIPALGIMSPITLLSGTMTSGTLTILPPPFSAAFFAALGTDTKAPELLMSLGISAGTPFAFGGFSNGFGPAVSCGESGKCYTAVSTDVLNTSQEAVPEPGTLLLLGGGLLGLARARRRIA
jgi:hypothetical protein